MSVLLLTSGGEFAPHVRLMSLRSSARPLGTKRGATLIELMVAGSIGLLILSAVVTVFSLAGRKIFWLQDSSDRQLVALSAMEQIRRDLLVSAPEGVHHEVDSLSIALQNSTTMATDRRWNAIPVVYGNRGGHLVRAESAQPAFPAASPPRLQPEGLRTALSVSPGWRHREFQGVTWGAASLTGPVVEFSVRSETRGRDGRLTVTELKSKVSYSL